MPRVFFRALCSVVAALAACAPDGGSPTAPNSRDPENLYSNEYYCSIGYTQFCTAANDTLPSHPITGSSLDRLYNAIFSIRHTTYPCMQIRGSLLDQFVDGSIRGFTGLYPFDDSRRIIGYNYGIDKIRISDETYNSFGQYADSLQRTLIHEMAHGLFQIPASNEALADQYEEDCDGSVSVREKPKSFPTVRAP